MVDIVDLLDDSSDDEAEQQSKPRPTLESSLAGPSTSSTWLRDVALKGYQTAPYAGVAKDSELGITKKYLPNPKRRASKDFDDDDDDEVLWIPTPIAKKDSAKKLAASVLSAQKKPPINARGRTDNDSDDSDLEVLVADPPNVRAQSAKTCLPFTSPASVLNRNSQNKPESTPKHISRLSFLRNDDDDDDSFLLKSLPSGLTKKTQEKVSKSQGENPIESWRKQVQTIAGSDRKERGPPNASNDSTPFVKKKTSNSGSVRSNRNSCAKNIMVRNSYAKTETPSSISVPNVSARQSSGGDRSASSLSVNVLSPHATKNSRILATNRYSSRSKKKVGRKRASPNAAVGSREATTKGELTCVVCPPKLRATTKKYPDLRPNIILALWKFARKKLVRDSYQGKRLDQFVGRIVDLVVSAPNFPIRTMGEYAIRKRGHLSKRGCGGLTVAGDSLARFEEELNSTGLMEVRYSNLPGKYFSISEACLVAMKETITSRWKVSQSKQHQQQAHLQTGPQVFPADESSQAALFSQKDYFVSLVDLISLIDRRLRPECPSRLERSHEADKGASYYLNRSTKSAEFKQIDKLLAPVEIPKADGSIQITSYLKKRMVGGTQHYQLMPLGFHKSVVISKRSLPASHGPYRFCNLHSVLPKYKRICLAVDLREGGGGDRYHKGLHTMCNKLDLLKIPYCVNTLRIGDYCFFSGDKLCPILVERKSVEDVAKSIDAGDGRWIRQKKRMYQGQYVFGYQHCRIAYIIEGKIEKHLVSNNFVGNARHKVSRDRFEQEVANLEGEGFQVLRTCSVDNSMIELSRWAESVTRDVQSGKLPLKYTYDEFLKEVDKIPQEIDFSRLAKYHAQQRKLATVDLISDGDSHGGHEENLFPIVLDDRLRKAEKRPALEDSVGSQSNMGASKRVKLDKFNAIESRERSIGNGGYPGSISAIASRIHPTETNESRTDEGGNDYANWTSTALREKCVKLGMKKGGSKTKLIERLLDPANRPPSVYLLRKQRSLYVPAKVDTASTAILVALQIEQDSASIGVEKYGGATKDQIYVMAEKIDIKKDPFCGGTTQTGPYRE